MYRQDLEYYIKDFKMDFRKSYLIRKHFVKNSEPEDEVAKLEELKPRDTGDLSGTEGQ